MIRLRIRELICWIVGHQWDALHRPGKEHNGKPVWIYTRHMCTRCFVSEVRKLDLISVAYP